jgi:hypothetical protein
MGASRCDGVRRPWQRVCRIVGDVTRAPLWLFATLGFACAATGSVVVDNHDVRATGFLEGRVVYSETREVIKFFPLAITPRGQDAGTATTDELGHYRVEVPAGAVVVGLDPGAVTTSVHAGQVTRLEVVANPYDITIFALDRLPTCPGAALYERIEGHPAPQSEIDALARAFLVSYASTYAEGGLVAIEVPGDRSLSAAALPRFGSPQLRLMTTAALHAAADLPHSAVFYHRFDVIDSDGRCALVTVIHDRMMPSNYSGIIFPSGTTALFERRGSAWVFLANVASWES